MHHLTLNALTEQYRATRKHTRSRAFSETIRRSSAREARTARIPAAAYRTSAARRARLRRPFTFTRAR